MVSAVGGTGPADGEEARGTIMMKHSQLPDSSQADRSAERIAMVSASFDRHCGPAGRYEVSSGNTEPDTDRVEVACELAPAVLRRFHRPVSH